MKHYLVAGASSGIGRATAIRLAKEGHRVTATFFTRPVPDEPGIKYHFFDAKSGSVPAEIIPEKLDGLIYSPGGILLKPFHRISVEEFQAGFQIHVMGAVDIIRAALPALKASGKGSIVLFSTVAVQTGMTFHAQVAACKGAIEGLTRSLAAELAPAIRVNAIAPSLTDTPLASGLLNTLEKKHAAASRHPLKRIGTPEDIAGAVHYLLNDESSWITGQIIHMDGGLSSLR